jgi:hypothetical protein
MLEIIGIFVVLICSIKQRYDLASFTMGIVIYTKLWFMTIHLNRIFNKKEKK